MNFCFVCFLFSLFSLYILILNEGSTVINRSQVVELLALWALNDKATEPLMTHFYDYLVAGESAGESLHDALK